MPEKLELWLPFSLAVITQPFAANDNDSYAASGLKGHTGIDFGAPYGTVIPNCAEGAFVYSILDANDPVLMAYRAVFTIIETVAGCYEISYGHCSQMSSLVGATPDVGEELALIGNTGEVFSNGVEITEAQKDAGSKAGAHLHFQVREIKKVPVNSDIALSGYKNWIQDANGMYQKDGFFYAIPNYDNGYNGCVDPTPFFNGFLAVTHDTTIANLTEQVSLYTQVVGIMKKLLAFISIK